MGATDHDALRAMEENMAVHLAHLPRHLHGGMVRDENDILLVDSGLPSDTFNAVCRARLEEDGAQQRITWAIGHFQTNQHPFTWWVGPTSTPCDLGERLMASGLSHGEVEVGMTLDLRDWPGQTAPPPGVEIRRVRTAAQLRDYVRVIAANWEPPDMSVQQVYERAAAEALRPACPARYFLGSIDGEPVATSECFLAHGVAGIYNVVTMPRARRRGLGTALTAAALHEARAQRYAIAVLQASSSGQRIYTRLGFTPEGEFQEYH
ncbi:MAG TPA: GNAT family N-acetyltransferase [Chloroflexota bacterium]